MTGRVGQDILLDLRSRVFDHFQKLSLSFHERYTSGRVQSRLSSDVEALAELLNQGFVNLVNAVLLIGGISVVLLVLDWQLALAVLAVFPVAIVLTWWFHGKAEHAYRATPRSGGVGHRALHRVARRHPCRARVPPRAAQPGDLRRPRRPLPTRAGVVEHARGVFGTGILFLGRLTTVIVLLYGGDRVLAGDMTVGVLAAFLLYLRRFFEPMQDLSQFYTQFQGAAAALEKLAGVLDEDAGRAGVRAPGAASRAEGATCTFDHVHFAYKVVEILPDLSIDIPAGQTLALVGATGAGKTTIATLMARFYDPTSGRVTLDGVDLRDLSDEDLRRAVVMVTQDNFLFSGTVADNIGFGRPDASRAEIEDAATADRRARLHPRAARRLRHRRPQARRPALGGAAPAGRVRPRVPGATRRCSSSTRPRRRSTSRASALVQSALRTLLADRTAVIIAHRLSTVEIADRVLVLERRPHRRGRLPRRPRRRRRPLPRPPRSVARQPRVTAPDTRLGCRNQRQQERGRSTWSSAPRSTHGPGR